MGKLKKSKNSKIDIEADGDSSGGFQNSNKQKDSKAEEKMTPFIEKKRKLSISKQSISEEEIEVKVPKKKKKYNSFSEHEVATKSKKKVQKVLNVNSKSNEAKVCIGNLPWNISIGDIIEFLSSAGQIQKVVLTNENNTTKIPHDNQFLQAYVIFQSFGSVRKAKKLNGTLWKGKKVEIDDKDNRESKTLPNKNNSSHIAKLVSSPIFLDREKKNFVPPFRESKSIFIGKLDPAVDEDQLKEIFLKYGPIKSMKRIPNGAFINYESVESCNAALERDNTELGGTNIFVRKQIPKANKFKAPYRNNSSMVKQIEKNILTKMQKNNM